MGVPLLTGHRGFLAAAVAAVALGGGAGAGGLLLMREDEDTTPRDAGALLAKAQHSMRDVAAELAAVRRLEDVHVAGRHAGEQAREVQELVAHAERRLAGNAALAEPVRAVLVADVAALTTIAQVEELDRRRLERWRPMRNDIRGAIADVSARLSAVGRVPELARSENPAPALTSGSTRVDGLVKTARKKLAKWQRRYRHAKAERRASLAVLDGYRSSMLVYLRDYDGLRTEMSDWIGKVDTTGVTFDEAYEFLADASGGRTRVRRGIATLDAPAAVASQHNTLLEVVDTSVAAVDQAYDGTIDYEFDFEAAYDDYRDVPGWRSFTEQSEQVAGRYASARASWDQAVANARKKISDRALPKAPEV
jgi:hypothetical protein